MPKGVYARKSKQEFKCDVEGCGAEFGGPHFLGRHKQAKHGIAGTSAASVSERAKRKSVGKGKGKGKVNHGNKHNTIVTTEGAIPLEVIAYATGRIQAICEGIAHQQGFAAREFTAGVAEYLRGASRG